MTDIERLAENSRRMREFNRAWSMALYNATVSLPDPPLLLTGDGSELPYALPAKQPGRRTQPFTGTLVGAGPDRWGYHAVTDPESHQPGDLWNDPVKGGIWCRVETPSAGGGMEPRWLRIM